MLTEYPSSIFHLELYSMFLCLLVEDKEFPKTRLTLLVSSYYGSQDLALRIGAPGL